MNKDILKFIDVVDFNNSKNSKWTLDDQLHAIKIIGECGMRAAIQYLENIYRPDIRVTHHLEWYNRNGITWGEINVLEKHHYVNASGPLANALNFEVKIFEGQKYRIKRIRSVAGIKLECSDIYKKSKAHITIRESIQKLITSQESDDKLSLL